MDLRGYEQSKFQLVELLRSSGSAGSRLPHPVQTQMRDLFDRLAEDRFNLVVVGRFSRGKTSRRYALKRDGLRRYLTSDEEEKAAEQALTLLAGHRDLNTPAPRQ